MGGDGTGPEFRQRFYFARKQVEQDDLLLPPTEYLYLETEIVDRSRSCPWKPGMFQLFRDIIILARDTGMRNGRELCRIRTEKPRLEQSSHFRTGRQDTRGEKNDPHE
jgi:hypothetical protein